jgi:DNA-binding PucR family transcriptional regulator
VLGPLVAQWPEIRIAVGRSGRGIDGFRRSHREAVTAQRAAAAARRPPALTLYESVELVSLLAADAEGMRAFVASELGPRIGSAKDSGRLTETALTFLQCSGNRSATARRLGVHRNTVRNRVIRAEELLSRTLDPQNVALQLALTLLVFVHPDRLRA